MTRCAEPPGPLAALAISRAGACLLARLRTAWPSLEVHAVKPYHLEVEEVRGATPPLAGLLGDLFCRSRSIVLVMPVGAAVRLIAPHLADKRSDPGVVVVDDGGRFAVALLSGHAGGGNDLARALARALRARAVITTAAERRRLPVLERLGQERGWKLEAGREALLRAAAALVDGGRVLGYEDVGVRALARSVRGIEMVETLDALLAASEPSMVVSDRRVPDRLRETVVVYRPPTLAAGVGCSTGVSAVEIVMLIGRALELGGLAPASLTRIGTLDRKLTEPGLVEAARQLSLPLVGYRAEQLRRVSVPNPSEVVRRAVGTPSVAEAAAIRASRGGALVVTKVVSPRATVAIARARRELRSAVPEAKR
ncbi:MAG: cobalamin biosynthesis protein [Chloroflexi bacterium]|nr:cobalamin biosynthesis protein [Chloroflexota bacterium]